MRGLYHRLEQRQNDTDGEIVTISVTLCRPQTSQGFPWDRTRISAIRSPRINGLCYSTAGRTSYNQIIQNGTLIRTGRTNCNNRRWHNTSLHVSTDTNTKANKWVLSVRVTSPGLDLLGPTCNVWWRATHLLFCSPVKGVTSFNGFTAVWSRYNGRTNSYLPLIQRVVETMVDTCCITYLHYEHRNCTKHFINRLILLHRVVTQKGKDV
jgi:hypothetical protein